MADTESSGTCIDQVIGNLLLTYILQKLSYGEKVIVETHLPTCPFCENQLRQWEEHQAENQLDIAGEYAILLRFTPRVYKQLKDEATANNKSVIGVIRLGIAYAIILLGVFRNGGRLALINDEEEGYQELVLPKN